MALSQSQLEQGAGDLLHRRRVVDDILNEGMEYRQSGSDQWAFGPMEVRYHPSADDTLLVESPDSDMYTVEIPDTDDPERIEHTERQLVRAWESWIDAL